jgi:hypothetical protein
MLAMFPFFHELAARAWDSAIASMSTSMLALLSAVAYGVYRSFLSYRNEGFQGVRKHFLADGLHALIFGIAWWSILFSYHFFLKVPREIRTHTDRIRPPDTPSPPSPPSFAFVKAVHATLPSFAFVIPAVVVIPDSWDFIIKHEGKQEVESIDLMFVDTDKLHDIQKSKTSALPSEYSIFLHVDKMYPKGRGSLFAKQFIWKPYIFEHEHYTAEISASTGRFHEDLFVEKVAGKWNFATKVTEIDTKRTLFICRDNGFPRPVALEIIARNNCFPGWIK